MRTNLDGSNPQELATLNYTGDLVLDPEGGKLYVSSLADEKIVRLNRDGTGLEDFIIGLESPSRPSTPSSGRSIGPTAANSGSNGPTSTAKGARRWSNSRNKAPLEILRSTQQA